jgi:HSP20 family protein
MSDQQKDFFSELKNEFKDLGSKVNKMFEEVVRGKDKGFYVVLADVTETSEAMVYSLDLPGVLKSDVNVQVRDNKLVVRGKRGQETSESGTNHISERAFGEFHREFVIPAGVDTSQSKAKFENGVLVVRLPKEATTVGASEVKVD